MTSDGPDTMVVTLAGKRYLLRRVVWVDRLSVVSGLPEPGYVRSVAPMVLSVCDVSLIDVMRALQLRLWRHRDANVLRAVSL